MNIKIKIVIIITIAGRLKFHVLIPGIRTGITEIIYEILFTFGCLYRLNNNLSILLKLYRSKMLNYFMRFKPVYLHSLFSRWLIMHHVDYMLFLKLNKGHKILLKIKISQKLYLIKYILCKSIHKISIWYICYMFLITI